MTERARLVPPASAPHRRPRLAAPLVALLAAITLAGTFGAGSALAASDELRLAVSTTYRVDPAKAAVHVTLDFTATNEKPDTASTLYFYNTLSLAVPLEAVSVKATSAGSKLKVVTVKKKAFHDVTVSYPNLYHGKTRKIRVTFDLPSGKPRSDAFTRVGAAYAAFSAWAWGDPGLGDVRIVLPPGFSADIQTDPDDADARLVSERVDGHTEYSVTDLDDPIGWYSSISATNSDALTDVAIEAGGEPVVIHAWPEDPDWVKRVSAVLENSLPDLKAAIGLPWPVTHDLEVTEVAAAELEGYAGFFDSSFDKITISEDLDDLTIVHEASHAWFDGSLFVERWIGEGLADEYASRILAADHPENPKEDPSEVAATDKAAFDLNTWRPPARIDADSEAYERFGYNASWTVMRAIVEDVTEEKMRDVFRVAAAQTLTYAGAGPAEPAGITPDWRRFLDIVTDVGGSTKAEDLLETWAMTSTQDSELGPRETARTRYFALVRSGGEWLPGVLIRKPMSNWQFPAAETAMAEAETVLADRDALTSATTELDLPFPPGLEATYESADSIDDLTSLETRIADWTAAAAAIRTARDALAAERPPLVNIGLFDTDPSAGYTAALAAFAAGDDKAVLAGSAATVAALSGAQEVGQGRATAFGVAIWAVLLLLIVLAVIARRRRRRPSLGVPVAAAVGTIGAVGAVGPDPAPWMPAQPPPAWSASEVPPPPVGVRRLDGTGLPQQAVPPPPVPSFDATDVPPPPTTVQRLAEDPYATLAATPDLVDDTQAGEPGARGAEPD